MLLFCCVAAMGVMARAYLSARGESDEPVTFVHSAIFWTALAGGVLIKGPLILMVAGLAAIVLIVMDRSAWWLWSLRPIPGVIWMLALVLPWFVAILQRSGEIDWGVAGSAYLGVFLVGAGYLSLGLLISAITTSQFLALVLTALLVLALFILGVGEFVTREGTIMHDICAHVSVWAHMNDFASGIVDSRRLVFYGALVVLPLFVTVRAVDAWRWG